MKQESSVMNLVSPMCACVCVCVDKVCDYEVCLEEFAKAMMQRLLCGRCKITMFSYILGLATRFLEKFPIRIPRGPKHAG